LGVCRVMQWRWNPHNLPAISTGSLMTWKGKDLQRKRSCIEKGIGLYVGLKEWKLVLLSKSRKPKQTLFFCYNRLKIFEVGVRKRKPWLLPFHTIESSYMRILSSNINVYTMTASEYSHPDCYVDWKYRWNSIEINISFRCGLGYDRYWKQYSKSNISYI
jgi:hypothetical protein